MTGAGRRPAASTPASGRIARADSQADWADDGRSSGAGGMRPGWPGPPRRRPVGRRRAGADVEPTSRPPTASRRTTTRPTWSTFRPSHHFQPTVEMPSIKQIRV